MRRVALALPTLAFAALLCPACVGAPEPSPLHPPGREADTGGERVGAPNAGEGSDARAREEIVAMVHRFEAGLIARDADGLRALFLSDEVPFVGVYVDPTGQPHSRPSHAGEFITDLVASTTSWEERFTGITVEVHDGIATLGADYVFLDGGQQTNHGREVWSLVRRDGGWKIVSVVWSVIPDP